MVFFHKTQPFLIYKTNEENYDNTIFELKSHPEERKMYIYSLPLNKFENLKLNTNCVQFGWHYSCISDSKN